MDGVLLEEAFAEPQRLPLTDEAGFTTGWRNAPMYRCIGCGAGTTRTVAIAARFSNPTGPGDMLIRLDRMAECPACGKQLGPGA